MKIGDSVRVNVMKSGYWYDYKFGVVTGITHKRVSVKTAWGVRSYLPRNVEKMSKSLAEK